MSAALGKKPSWQGLSRDAFDRLASDPTQVEAWRAECEAGQKEYSEAGNAIRAEYKQMIELARRVFARTPKVLRYLEQQSPDVPRYPYSLERELDDAKVRRERKSEDARIAQKKRDADALLARAVAFLISKGKAIGADFEAHDAIRVANDLRFDELVAEAKKESWHAFIGEAYCEGCRGWDGESKRCECGNRRVGWVTDGNFEDMTLHAEAH